MDQEYTMVINQIFLEMNIHSFHHLREYQAFLEETSNIHQGKSYFQWEIETKLPHSWLRLKFHSHNIKYYNRKLEWKYKMQATFEISIIPSSPRILTKGFVASGLVKISAS